MKKIHTHIYAKDYRNTAGFTLFISLIVSSLVLAIGFSLSTIILKQLIFSNSGKESQLAFFAADSGAECAMYWDRKDVDGYTVFDSTFASSSPDTEIFCGTGGLATSPVSLSGRVGSFYKIKDGGNEQATTTFYVDYSDALNSSHKACAMVTVFKWVEIVGSIPLERTRIDSRGYNVPMDNGAVGLGYSGNGATCDFGASNRVVERAIQLDY